MSSAQPWYMTAENLSGTLDLDFQERIVDDVLQRDPDFRKFREWMLTDPIVFETRESAVEALDFFTRKKWEILKAWRKKTFGERYWNDWEYDPD